MNRIINLTIRLSPKERDVLQERANKSGVPITSYIRKTALGKSLREKPDEEFYDYMNYLRTISNSLNQIAVKANTYNYIDAEKMNELAKEHKKFLVDIRTKYLGSG